MTVQTQDISVELDGGPHRHEPERLCAVTRAVRPISELIRFVVGPGAEAVPDIKNKLPGRGIWLTATREALEDAVKRRVFSRGFKRDVRLPADLPLATEQLLERAALEALAVANKAGLAAVGFGKVVSAIEHEAVIALFHAAEAASDGTRKIDAAFRRRQPGGPATVIESLTSAQLDLALGRPNVVHAALLAGPAGDTFMSRWRRLERFRTGGAGDRGNLAGRAAAQTGRGHG